MRPQRRPQLGMLLALAVLVQFLVPAAPAVGAITFVQNLGTGTSFGTSTTITTTGAVTAGHSIIVSVATNNNGTTITCSDPVNGAYATDVQGGSQWSAICSKHNVQALPLSSTITVNSSA